MPWSTCLDQYQSFRSVPYVKYMFSSDTELPFTEHPGHVGVPPPPLVPPEPLPLDPPPLDPVFLVPEPPLLPLPPDPPEPPPPETEPLPEALVPLPPPVDFEENVAEPL